MPMTNGKGPATLRLLAQWGLLSPEQIQNFALHSSKTALLWTAQLSLSEEMRAVQGYHRRSAQNTSRRPTLFLGCTESFAGDVGN